MTVLFSIEHVGEGRWFTADPEVVTQNPRQIQVGDYVKLPDGHIFHLVSRAPTTFEEVPEVPENATLLTAVYYS